jgi:hypothetical protein
VRINASWRRAVRRAGGCALLLASAAALAEEGVAPDPPAAGTPASESSSLPIPSPEELEASGAVIGRIIVVPGDIFDPAIKGEDRWLYRAANRVHMNTKPGIIREQLLVKPGDPYNLRLVQESERILREQPYLYSAQIVPVAYDGHTVDLEVRTRDVWTLNPGFNFGRSGGQNSTSVHVQEKNLFGTGRQVEVGWGSNVDNSAWTVSYIDPQFLRPFTRLVATYSDASDGSSKYLFLDRPFYALDTRWAAGTTLSDVRADGERWELGKKVGEFNSHNQFYQAYGGWSRGLVDGWTNRWTAGMTWQEDDFEPAPNKPLGGPLPPDRKFVYPWIAFERVQDAYQTRVNQNQISRTEDVLVGFHGWLRLGYASESLGSKTDALIWSAFAEDGTDLGPRQSLFGSSWASGRLESGGLTNGIFGAESRYYLATSARSKFFASVSGVTTHNLDEDQQLTLGGDTGLRGYPYAYQAGTSKALLTLEQRYYTTWYPFRLFHVAGAVFYDMGRTWGRDVTGETSLGLLKDVGFGLRLGSSRSGFGNVVHIDLAFPLDGDPSIDKVQFIVETTGTF